MKTFELIAPCHFGLEAVLKREIIDLGYEISEVENGRVTFIGDAEAICRANVFLRTAERVLLKVGSFRAETFEELFQKTKAIPWESYIPKNGKFWVAKAASVNSKLFSPSDIQSIMKKAMVNRMKENYDVEWFPEDGASYPVRVFLMKDIVTVGIDTSGTSLHKRGYRQLHGKAPITETLAAALLLLTPLMNVGPMEDGSVREIDRATLNLMGRWVEYFGEAIYNPEPTNIEIEGKPDDFILKYEKCYYLFCYNLPMSADPNVALVKDSNYASRFQLEDEIEKVVWLDNGAEVIFEQENRDVTVMTVPYTYGRSLVVRVAKIICK